MMCAAILQAWFLAWTKALAMSPKLLMPRACWKIPLSSSPQTMADQQQTPQEETMQDLPTIHCGVASTRFGRAVHEVWVRCGLVQRLVSLPTVAVDQQFSISCMLWTGCQRSVQLLESRMPARHYHWMAWIRVAHCLKVQVLSGLRCSTVNTMMHPTATLFVRAQVIVTSNPSSRAQRPISIALQLHEVA